MKSTTKSKKEHEKALKYIPGGVNSPVRAFKSVREYPIVIKKGKGPRIFDMDDNEYIDYCLSWGVSILGHANDIIDGQVIKAVKDGSSFGIHTELETRLAQVVVDSVPSIEQVRFVNSGTEAVMSAIRLARGYTRRNLVIKFDGCYHGHSDQLLIAAGSGLATVNIPSSLGIPESITKDTISLPFNDIETFSEVFTNLGDKIAAVILEPVPANMGVVLPDLEFLKKIRQLCTSSGAVLIFDEVITGFRNGIGGAQGNLNIIPDLTTLGKIIGGGFPVGAFGGKKEIMQHLAPVGKVYQAGTLAGNPVAMSAGLAALELLKKDGIYNELHENTKKFQKELDLLIKNYNISANFYGPMFTIFFSQNQVKDFNDVKRCDLENFKRFHSSLLDSGIYFSPSQFEANFLSLTHTDDDLGKTLEVIASTLKNL